MHNLQAVLPEAIADIWSSTLGLTAERDAAPLAADAPDVVLGCVCLHGPTTSAVLLTCARGVARTAAASMFDRRDDQLTEIDVRDAVGELANIAAGNVKAMLAEHCTLSLPVTQMGAEPAMFSDVTPVAHSDFACEAGLFTVQVFDRAA